MVLFSRDILAWHPGAVIVSEVKCSQRLFDDIAQKGGQPIMWKVGHSLLKAKMRETGALLGGEMSGHKKFYKPRYCQGTISFLRDEKMRSSPTLRGIGSKRFVTRAFMAGTYSRMVRG